MTQIVTFVQTTCPIVSNAAHLLLVLCVRTHTFCNPPKTPASRPVPPDTTLTPPEYAQPVLLPIVMTVVMPPLVLIAQALTF